MSKNKLRQIQQEEFMQRHIGPNENETAKMLQTLGISSLNELIDKTVPASIRLKNDLNVSTSISEYDYLKHVTSLGNKNTPIKSLIGKGYYGTITPAVILRNVFENPGWYTQYTPYQAEIAQGRLESLLNFQTMISDLTALPISNASLLDEATAAAEGMTMLFAAKGNPVKNKLFIDKNTFAQTIDVVETRALPIGIELIIGEFSTAIIDETYFAALLQYPNASGEINDYKSFIQKMNEQKAGVIMACDILSLALLTPPGELGADVSVGSTQRFGVPVGFGGPHAAYFATKEEYKRTIPGRIIGVSIDAQGNRCLRMALQTREQHIRREKATSNICTAQALLANIAALYAVYHGQQGIKNIALRVSIYTQALANALGENCISKNYFDTLTIKVANENDIIKNCEAAGYNVFGCGNGHISISIDETCDENDIENLKNIFGGKEISYSETLNQIPQFATRTSEFLTHPVFNSYHSESLMMRYLKSLEDKDLALNRSMISLGSCTMKLNAASEMIPVSQSGWANIHPFAPRHQWKGYDELINELEKDLAEITGFDACSLQPNSGAQGEYAGLLVIKAYHESRGDNHRNVILIPTSAHGTNPASAAMCGFKIVIVQCDDKGNIDVADMKAKAALHAENLAGLMITYPSTHGVFEETIIEICQTIHDNGGQVYMDGANMNAQVGLTSPGHIGADVCHLNLHKTFAIPHGGGGPGMGPICVKSQLAPFLPGHVSQKTGGGNAIKAVSAAPFGSASILLISYGYIKMLGAKGLKDATIFAILNANYMRARLEKEYKILYAGANGMCAHEFIIDLRPFKASGIEAEDVAKRLMDFGFHAPTLSFPVAGTLMIEPTESEDKAELDRFCDALLEIRKEIADVVDGKVDAKENVLKSAPHTQALVTADEWTKTYSRKQAAFPLPFVSNNKFWPSIGRVNNTAGDRNLICTCEPIESYMEENA
ncbi:MAG: aminomethyl-transferring glycine dehydrogenase [Chitinophagaceae bacterium]|nr:aminomethyl-transferring glycine dehydrogenase [Chitinophagaceae bacterium]